MTEKVLVRVTGEQLMEGMPELAGSNEPIELVTMGNLTRTEDGWVLEYEETFDEEDMVTVDTVTISRSRVQVCKKGVIGWDAIFEEGKHGMTFYETPFGDMPMDITPSTVRVSEEKGCPQVYLRYVMCVDDKYKAECSLTIRTELK